MNADGNIINSILSQISTIQMETTKNKMVIAAKIYDHMQAKNINKEEMSKKLKISLNDMAFFLSGTKDFNVGELTKISLALDTPINELI